MLKISNLSFGFRHQNLFQDLNASIADGEMTHIHGPNGAGKSTLVSLIAGTMSPNSGKIEFFDDDNEEPVADRNLYIEYLPAEANGLFQKLGALDNLKFWSELRGAKKSEQDLIDALKIWDLDNPLIRNSFSVDKFSTGMKRRLALARLMLSPAPCWLLDEPFYGLDDKAIKLFKDIMSVHLKKGGSIIVVTHEVSPISDMITGTLALGGRG
jgi:heme exporter protein A